MTFGTARLRAFVCAELHKERRTFADILTEIRTRDTKFSVFPYESLYIGLTYCMEQSPS